MLRSITQDCTRLIPGGFIFSTYQDGACVLPISSLPEAADSHSLGDIDETVPSPITELEYPLQHTVSHVTLHDKTARLAMYSEGVIRGLAFEYDGLGSELKPKMRALKLVDVSKRFDGRTSVSGDFILTWDGYRDGCRRLILHHVPWSDNQVVRIPSVCVDQTLPFFSPTGYACMLDAASGRIVVQLEDHFVVLEFAFLGT